ncbi:MAG: YceD family protein [Candidatus Fimenecus sp.]
MQLQLEQIFNIDGSCKELKYSFEPEYSLCDDFKLTSPVEFEGEVRNNTGIVSLSGKAKFSATVTCGRCAELFKKDFEVEVEHLLASKLVNDDNDEYIVVEDNVLDLTELVCEDIILSLPTRFLCKEDCKGICSKCGKNLNEGKCDCKKDVDPRMAALLELLTD